MDCREIHDRIRNGLAAAASPGERRALEDHLAQCARCRDLIEPELATVVTEAPPGLLEDVLRQTSGPVCAVAEERLCQDLDGELDGLDAELVNAHADACRDCGLLRAVLSELAGDLESLRELMPDGRFVDDVLGVTTDDAALPFAARVRKIWNRLVQRPRFAWEAAYVGAMLFWLVLGAPADPLTGAPERIRGVLPEMAQSSSAFSSLRGDVATLGSRAWGAASGAWTSSLTRIETGLSVRTERAEEAIVVVQQHGAELREALRTLDFGSGGRVVGDLTRDAVNRLVTQDTEDNNEQE